MRLLQLGMKGDDVEDWQNFLTGKGYLNSECDGHFGPKTETATKAAQKRWNLPQDGKLNRSTLSIALALGFMNLDGGEDKEDPSWPPVPANFGPASQEFRDKHFEKFDYKPAPTSSNPEKVDIDDAWEKRNIITVKIPQLNKVEGYNVDGVRFHKVVAPRVIELFYEWEKLDLLHLVKTWNGSYVTRFVRGSRKNLSNHAYGSAFDINVRWNQLGVAPALVNSEGSVRELVPSANKLGFWWGGHFKKRPDGMHFEMADLPT